MARVMRAQVAFGADTAFPRDRMAITPHFNDTLDGNAQTLADDLANKFDTFFAGVREVSVKVYDAQAPKPNPPMATAIKQSGLTPASPGDREVALCLSFYAGQNVKRKRGRVYIPAIFITTGALPVRPSSTHRDTLAQFVTIFSTSGPASVAWAVFSRVDNIARPVTNYWVDDEWDSQRRRGLRPTTRTTAAVATP